MISAKYKPATGLAPRRADRITVTKKMFKLEPETSEEVKILSKGFEWSESSIVQEALRWYITAIAQQSARAQRVQIAHREEANK